MDRILLHSCCAPCANQPLELLLGRGFAVQLFYANSNIQPQAEYQRRLDTLKDYLDKTAPAMPLIEAEYDSAAWLQAIGSSGGVYPLLDGADANRELRRQRCRLCYRQRLGQLAAKAAELGVPCIATTLAVSPYQFHDLLAEELEAAAQAYGLTALYEDWRPLYAQGQAQARQLGLYRQRYCGCEFSRQEAEQERAARKA